MKHWHEEMPFTADNSLAELIFTENSLFFDIETTGFSAARTSRVNESKLIVVDELKLDSIKTKNFVQVLNNLKVEKALVVLNDMDTNVIKSASNVPTVKTAQTNELNVFDVLKYDTVVVTKDAVKTIEEVYA